MTDHTIDTIHQCPRCTWPLERVFSKKKERYYWFCSQPQEASGADTCSAIYSEDAEGNPILKHLQKGVPDARVKCPECGAPMSLIKGGKFGDFWGCSKREETGCKGSVDVPDATDPYKLPPLCPTDKSHGPMRVRSGKNGKFWGCRRYPECTQTLEIAGQKKGGSR